MIPQRLNDLNLIYPEVRKVDLKSPLCLFFKIGLPVCECMWFYRIIDLTTAEHAYVLGMEVYFCRLAHPRPVTRYIELHQDIYLNHWSLKRSTQVHQLVHHT